MPDTITINKKEVGLGEHAFIDLKIARLPTYTNIDMPVHIYRGEKDGPVLLLTGGLHGDELNGIEIIRTMIEEETIIPDKGTVIAIPLVNVYGFIQSERGVPDGKDINRSFPGVKTGSLARFLAYTMMNEIVPQIDVGIDFHTGGSNRANYPQIRSVLDLERNKELALAFAAPFTVNSALIDKSFRKAAHRKGKHILVYETGEALRFDEAGIREGIHGTLRLMQYLDMRSDAPEGHDSIILKQSRWIRAKFAGLFKTSISTGDNAGKGDSIGVITDPFGNNSFTVKSPFNGYVIGLNNNPVVHKGDALLHLGKK